MIYIDWISNDWKTQRYFLDANNENDDDEEEKDQDENGDTGLEKRWNTYADMLDQHNLSPLVFVLDHLKIEGQKMQDHGMSQHEENMASNLTKRKPVTQKLPKNLTQEINLNGGQEAIRPSKRRSKNEPPQIFKQESSTSDYLLDSATGNDNHSLRRKYLLLEEESFSLGKVTREIQESFSLGKETSEIQYGLELKELGVTTDFKDGDEFFAGGIFLPEDCSRLTTASIYSLLDSVKIFKEKKVEMPAKLLDKLSQKKGVLNDSVQSLISEESIVKTDISLLHFERLISTITAN